MIRILAAILLIVGFSASLFADEQRSRLSQLLSADADERFARATEPRAFSFPADHGPHPEFRNEWWYFTGNLDDDRDNRFGFELTVFRFSLSPENVESDSAWRTNQVYIAHLAVTDAAGESFSVAQRYSRGAAGLAGAEENAQRIWIDDWTVSRDNDDRWSLRAADESFGIALDLVPLRDPVLNGEQGLSTKSAEPGNASYYYSLTRLDTSGTLQIGDQVLDVNGLAWMDREWSTSALGSEQVGWDWFALQFDDGSDLMVYQLRNRDGAAAPYSSGTWAGADGSIVQLQAEDIEIEVLDDWQSPRGGTYPARWNLRIPRVKLDVVVEPVIADQELITTVRYWEGAVDVSGSRRGQTSAGRGYVELTGYDDS